MAVEISSMVKFYTVLLLAEEPKHGYELMKELEKKTGKKISTSQVYPFLEILARNSLIVIEATGAREKKRYKLTREGKRFVRDILNRFGDLIHIAIEPQLKNCAHCGCKLIEVGHKESIKGKDMNFCCSHCASSFKRSRR